MPVPFDPAECSTLVEDASSTLKEVNRVISSFATAPLEAEQQLASPSEPNCRNCPFRPACVAYHKARAAAIETEGWPNDVRGSIDEIRELGNSKIAIVVKPGGSTGSSLRVTGLNPDPGRHPAIQQLQQGDQVGLYNLKSSKVGNTFSEGLLTVIYKIDDMDGARP